MSSMSNRRLTLRRAWSALSVAAAVTAPPLFHASADGASADTYLPWEGGPAYYLKWSNGVSADPGYFPISVWLQDPKYAREYKAIGINLYVGLWRGPNDQQLAALAAGGMPVLAGQRR